MTYREYVTKYNSSRLQKSCRGGVEGCPGGLDREMLRPTNGPIMGDDDCRLRKASLLDLLRDTPCTECWDQEMPAFEPTAKDQGKIVYIAGPITGVEEYWKAFEAAEEDLRGQGYITLLPSRLPEGMTNAQYMRICLAMIDTADWVYFLPGSELSRGARLELDYCLYIGKPYQWHEGGGEE